MEILVVPFISVVSFLFGNVPLRCLVYFYKKNYWYLAILFWFYDMCASSSFTNTGLFDFRVQHICQLNLSRRQDTTVFFLLLFLFLRNLLNTKLSRLFLLIVITCLKTYYCATFNELLNHIHLFNLSALNRWYKLPQIIFNCQIYTCLK